MWKLIIFITILFFILVINSYYKNIQTNYKINFIDNDLGCKILSNTNEPYLNKLNKKEMIVKKCIKSEKESNKECIVSYCNSAIKWDKLQKKAVHWVLDPIITFLQHKYPK